MLGTERRTQRDQLQEGKARLFRRFFRKLLGLVAGDALFNLFDQIEPVE